ncbi:hypothetical protein FKM82_002904, partial [Ascaphus truei]
ASLRSTPCAHWGTYSNWGSRRSSWNSLGRAPSIKKKNQSGERESLLSGEGKGSTDDDSDDCKSSSVGRGSLLRRTGSLDTRGSLDVPEFLQVPTLRHSLSVSPLAMVPSEYQDCNGKMMHVPSDLFVRVDKPKEEPLDYEDDIEDSYCFRIRKTLEPYKPEWCKTHEDWALYLFSPQNQFRAVCQKVIAHKMFDHVVLVFIFLNCITIALERPDIDANSMERIFLSVSNYIFTAIFIVEMAIKVMALGFLSGENAYLKSSWNVLDGILVFVSIIDIIVSLASAGGAKILGILRVLRLLRTLRPLRVISRAPGLKLVVETLISSLRPIGNIVLICCAFFIIFGILGVQLFKGKFYYCEGLDTRNVTNRSDCSRARYKWVRRKYNFDNLGQEERSWPPLCDSQASLIPFPLQPVRNHNPWMLLYFISFLLIVSFFVLNMFVGVVVENFHKCRQHQEAEEARRREEKRLRRLEKKRRSKALYMSGRSLEEALKYCNYVFTIVFVFEAVFKLVAFGFRRFFKDRWNQLDLAIVLLSIMGITLEEIEINASLPINPTIIRIMRVLRIARVLKLLKMATGMRALLDTVVQALPQVGNLGLLFMLLFFIYAALGVELFGKLVCNDENPCDGLSRHATFDNFGMAFLTLFRVSTGDNWNGIMKDTLRECSSEDKHCLTYLPLISPVYFVTFVLIAQFVLVNVVVAVLMKHLEESNKEAKEDAEMDAEIEMEMSRALTPATGGCTPTTDNKAPGGSQEPVKIELLKQARDGAVYMRDGAGSQNLLAVRKVSVSRMLSLPNDSYMFRPVLPAKSSYPLREVECYEDQSPMGSVTSVNSQLGDASSLLRVPVECQPLASTSCHQDAAEMPKIPPPHSASRSPSLNKLLRRQEAIRMDSVDYQNGDSKDSIHVESTESLQRRTPSLGTLVPILLCPTPLSLQGTPQSSPMLSSHHRHSSVHTRNHVYSQHSIPSRPSSGSSGSTNPEESMFESSDLADEEVSHINSSAKSWRGQSDNRSHSVSPFISQTSSPPPLLKNGNSTASLAGTSSKDLKKFYSVDTQGFLAKPTWAEDQRRHSIEICPSIDDGDSCFDLLIEEKHCPSVLIQSDPEYINGVRRKKKMSPPCISIDPPMEDENGTASRTKASENSTMLRRRTPSCESTAYRDSLDLGDTQPGDQTSKTERRVQLPCRNEHLTIPSYSFDQLDANSFSDLLSESGCSTPPPVVIVESRPEPAALEMKQIDHLQTPSSNPEMSRDFIGVAKGTLKKPALVHVSNTTDEVSDKQL